MLVPPTISCFLVVRAPATMMRGKHRRQISALFMLSDSVVFFSIWWTYWPNASMPITNLIPFCNDHFASVTDNNWSSRSGVCAGVLYCILWFISVKICSIGRVPLEPLPVYMTRPEECVRRVTSYLPNPLVIL